MAIDVFIATLLIWSYSAFDYSSKCSIFKFYDSIYTTDLMDLSAPNVKV